MDYDETIRRNEKILADLEARLHSARAAEALQQRENERSAPKVEHPEGKDIPPEHDARNEVVVTREARLLESPQDIQEQIDVVKKLLEVLRQGKEWEEIDKERPSKLAGDIKENLDDKKEFKKEVEPLTTTPDHHESQWVSDAHSHPQPDPITAALLNVAVVAGLGSEIMGSKWIAETVEKTNETYETAKQNIKDAVADGKEAIKEGVEKAKEALENTREKAKDMVRDALTDPALAAKEKEQAAERKKKEIEIQENIKAHAERCDLKGMTEDQKDKHMEKVEKAAQVIRDNMIKEQAKELERMRRMEEAHRARW